MIELDLKQFDLERWVKTYLSAFEKSFREKIIENTYKVKAIQAGPHHDFAVIVMYEIQRKNDIRRLVRSIEPFLEKYCDDELKQQLLAEFL